MAIDNAISDPPRRPDLIDFPDYGSAAPMMPGVKPATPAARSGATSFSAQGAAKPVATGVKATPAPLIPRPELTANSAGKATASAIGTGLRALDTVRQTQARGTAGLAAGVIDGASAPMRRAATGVVNFGRGLIGLEAQSYDATPTQDALASTAPSVYGISRPALVQAATPTAQATTAPVAVPRPGVAPVRGSAGPVGGGSATPAGGTSASPTPAAAMPAPMVTPPARPGDLDWFTGANGVTRAIAPATGAATVAPGAGTASVIVPPAAAATPALARPVLPEASPAITPGSQNVSRSGEVRDMRAAALSEIGSQLFQLHGQNTRSSRAAIGDLMSAQAGLVNNAADNDAQLAGGNRDAAVRAGTVGAVQAGENARTALEAATRLQDRAFQEEAATERFRRGLERPTLQVDADGDLLQVDGTTATPVTSANGAPVRVPQANTTLTPDALLDAYTRQYEATLASVPIGADASPYLQRFAASPIAQAYQAVLRGAERPNSGGPNSAPKAGTIRAGYRFKGGDPSNKSNWERVAP